MRVRVTYIVAIAALAAGIGGPLSAQSGQYSKTGEIQIGGTSVRFDYLNVDSAGKRLYVSNSTSVVVIDLVTKAVVGRIADTPGVHGIAIAPELGKVFTSNGQENKVSIVDAKTLATVGKVDTAGANPDAILYEPKWKQVWAFNHTGKSATAIDATTGKVLATIPLSGTAETGTADPTLGRVYVNIEDEPGSVDVIDVKTMKLIATWPVTPAATPTGMAIDQATHRLFVGGGPNTVMMDGNSGKVIASLPICSGTDATWYDAASKLVFSSCGSGNGAITVGKVEGDKITPVQNITTVRGARTMALDSATHNLYVVGQKYVPADPNAPAPAGGRGGRGGPPAIADSFHVEIFGMGK